MKLVIFFVLLSVCQYTECVGAGQHHVHHDHHGHHDHHDHRRLWPIGRFNDLKSVTLLIREKNEVQASAIVLGNQGSVLDNLISVARVDPPFEFSCTYTMSAGIQLTGINNQRNNDEGKWEVLRSPKGDTSEIPITSGLETLVPETGDTIIFERKEKCVNPLNNLLVFSTLAEPRMILNDQGLVFTPNMLVTLTFDVTNVKEVYMEYVTTQAGSLTFKGIYDLKVLSQKVETINPEESGSFTSLIVPVNNLIEDFDITSDNGVTIKNLCAVVAE